MQLPIIPQRYRWCRLALPVMALAGVLAGSCAENTRPVPVERFEAEILAAERDFARMAAAQGVRNAFLAYAADDAVLSRNDRLIRGRQEIAEYFDAQTLTDVQLEWEADFVSVSAAGDLGYTYGHYTFRATDDRGQAVAGEGVFHTVWRRGDDGRWRYVWD